MSGGLFKEFRKGVDKPTGRSYPIAMPTYEYECGSCKYKFEVFQSIKDRPRRKCPKCGKRVRRLIGAGSAVIFKGSGFYQTDYRSSDYKKKAESEGKAGSAASDKPGGNDKAGSDKEKKGD